MTSIRKGTLFFMGIGLASIVVASAACSTRPRASGSGTTDAGPVAGSQSKVSTGSVTYLLDVVPTQVAVGHVVSATTTLRNASKHTTLALGGTSFATHHIVVVAADGQVVFDSTPVEDRFSPGQVPKTLLLAPGEASSVTITFTVSAVGTYEVVADEDLWDQDADRSVALRTKAVRIVVAP
jgi:hypothetical protein